MPADAAEPEPGQGESAPRTLAEKVEWLIRHMWPPGRPPETANAGVARAITAVTGEEISSSSVWKMRTGRGDNPTLGTLTALSEFFGVPLGYFGQGEEAESAADQAALLALLREDGISRAALRSLAGLSPDGRAMIADMIAAVARREQRGTGGGTPGSRDG